MQTEYWQIIVFLVSLVATVGVTFYLKDFLQKRNEYASLRTKLEKIAGKNAVILYNPGGAPSGPLSGLSRFKIVEFDRYGVTLEDEMQTVFVPAAKLLQSEMILPGNNYETAKIEKMKKDMEQMIENMVPAMFNKLFPPMMEAIQRNFLSGLRGDDSEVSAVFALKIRKLLDEEGIELRRMGAGVSTQTRRSS